MLQKTASVEQSGLLFTSGDLRFVHVTTSMVPRCACLEGEFDSLNDSQAMISADAERDRPCKVSCTACLVFPIHD
jgi:hypothetical protein